MSPHLLPITLTTASALCLMGLVLAFRCGAGRAKHHVMMGDGGNEDMIVRMRTQANFVEYVPLALILLGLLEMGGANHTALVYGAAALVLFRVMHAVGMPRPAPNVFRAGSAIGTFLLVAAGAIYGLTLAFGTAA
jgi:uncharacterized membrane protein YecN with MAPEG domain